MAKERKANTIVSAISAVTAALRLESIPNPTAEQLQQIHEAKVAAADVIDSSNFVAMGESADEAIEANIVAEEEAEAEAEAIALAEADAEVAEELGIE
jgi:hypothetical protein